MADITSIETTNTSPLASIISYEAYQKYFDDLFDQRSGGCQLYSWSSAPCECGKDWDHHALGLRRYCYYCHIPSEDDILEFFKWVNQINSLRTPSGRPCEECHTGTVYRFSKSGGHGSLHVYAPCHYCLTISKQSEPPTKKECHNDHELEGH